MSISEHKKSGPGVHPEATPFMKDSGWKPHRLRWEGKPAH